MLRMLILERIRYLLTQWKPARPIVNHLLQILLRFVRHSSSTAYEVSIHIFVI